MRSADSPALSVALGEEEKTCHMFTTSSSGAAETKIRARQSHGSSRELLSDPAAKAKFSPHPAKFCERGFWRAVSELVWQCCFRS